MKRTDGVLLNLVPILLAALLVPASALATLSPGALDPSFGTGGTVLTPVGFISDANALAVQSDGKLVVAGDVNETGTTVNTKFALARYNPDGTLDPSFGTGGTVITPIGSGTIAGAYSLVIQDDGKIVAAGSAVDGGTFQSKLALARYNPDGTLDSSFGTGGTVLTAVGSGTHNIVSSVALQGDGKLVLAGSAEDGATNNYKLALTRYNPDGTLDSSFGTGGTALTPVGSDNSAYAYSLVLQGDGKLVAAGSADDQSITKFALARYNPDGTLDSSFGTGGTVLTPIGSDNSAYAYSLVRQGDGKLVAAGSADDASITKFALARYNQDGSLDSTFGSGGTVLTAIGNGGLAYANSLALQGGDTVVAAGSAHDGVPNVSTPAKFALARYGAGSAASQPPPGPGPSQGGSSSKSAPPLAAPTPVSQQHTVTKQVGCVVPRVRGLSVKKAKRKLAHAGCRYRIRGKGRVTSTSPPAGTRTTKTVLVKTTSKRHGAKRKGRKAGAAAHGGGSAR